MDVEGCMFVLVQFMDVFTVQLVASICSYTSIVWYMCRVIQTLVSLTIPRNFFHGGISLLLQKTDFAGKELILDRFVKIFSGKFWGYLRGKLTFSLTYLGRIQNVFLRKNLKLNSEMKYEELNQHSIYQARKVKRFELKLVNVFYWHDHLQVAWSETLSILTLTF